MHYVQLHACFSALGNNLRTRLEQIITATLSFAPHCFDWGIFTM